jgi:streptogrisin C
MSIPKLDRPLSLMALALACALPMAAIAAQPAPHVAQAMKRDLKLDDAQLAQYLRTEAAALQREGQARQVLGEAYAGSWIERGADGEFRFVVASTGRGLGGGEVRPAR